MLTVSSAEPVPQAVLREAVSKLADHLLSMRDPCGVWRGHLSSSALATATAISAMATNAVAADQARIVRGTQWLIADQHTDGGWGDSPESPSNLSTTLLALAALRLASHESPTADRARDYVAQHAGATPVQWVAALQRHYGADRTFAIPILTNLALAGLVPWKLIPPLPFALAAFPRSLYRLLRLEVVSYALPALIAIGTRLAHEQRKAGVWSQWARPKALAKLPALQPSHGGFLDAVPLTSFVAMSLAGLPDAPVGVADQCLSFLRSRQRDDGSWPIDTDLAMWVTTASVAALSEAHLCHRLDASTACSWITAAQHQQVHPYTGAAPGGWAWTDLPGGVPDADDTSGAIIALAALEHPAPIEAGVHWLLSLQNRDGGFPTFCRGWSKLPFDHSAPEITAHAIRAMHSSIRAASTAPVYRAIPRALQYLANTQAADGSWRPLWFGNQHTPDHASRVIGTAKVLRALAAVPQQTPTAGRAVQYLVNQQNPDGGWGGRLGVESSVEETALAVSALCDWQARPETCRSTHAGIRYLLRAIAAGAIDRPSPIGLYFSSLWYSEKLYPIIWTLEALGRTMHSTEQ